MADTLINLKGLADVLVAAILTVNPSLIYGSFPARALASSTGLHLSNASSAPGFNQSIACMVAAVGVGHVVAARCGPAAQHPMLAMNTTWAVLAFLTCLTPRAWELGSATLLMTSMSHATFSLALYLLLDNHKQNKNF